MYLNICEDSNVLSVILLIKDVINLNELNGGVYIEPYAGGAALALSLFTRITT